MFSLMHFLVYLTFNSFTMHCLYVQEDAPNGDLTQDYVAETQPMTVTLDEMQLIDVHVNEVEDDHDEVGIKKTQMTRLHFKIGKSQEMELIQARKNQRC